MPKLVFRVSADYEEVIKLRNEIEKLKKELKGMDATSTPHTFNTLNEQLSASTRKMDELVTEAAKAGAEMEQGFKKKIFDASQTVNDFTERIIAQKAVVKNVEADVKRLGEAYRTAKKNNPWGADAHLAEYNAARKALDEEKAALFGLTQQQAEARLSVKKLRDEYALFKDDSKETVAATDNIGFSLKKAFAVIGGAALGKQLISDMIRVRGEFQAADTAIQTILGSEEKAAALMSKVRDYAKISPLEFSDVTQATQMMLGFNIEAEKVPKFLSAIGDVSMGNTQKFNSLTLAFSQMSAAGKLMGQDLNQMINAGFNPLQQMAQTTGKSIAQLKEEMSKGAISAEMVQQAFIDATSAGGKFYKMSENASKTINGQLSMMQDAMDAAFNEMGQKSEGFIMGGIQMTTKLIENYETVGKVLAGLVVTYGVYKAALITNIALTHSLAVAAKVDAVAKGIQTVATKAQTAAQWALNAAMAANPYALAAMLVAGLVSSLIIFTKNTNQAEEAQKRLNDVTSNMRKEIVSEQADIDVLFNDLQNAKKGTDEYRQAKEAILNKYGKYLEGLNVEIRTLNNVKGAYDAITIAATKAARARGMETAMRGAQEAYGESYSSSAGKLYDKLQERVGDTKATSLLRRLQSEINKTGKASQKLRDEIGNIFRGSATYGNSRAWITSMENATKSLRNETKKIKAVFGDVDNGKKDGKEKTTTYQEDLNNAKTEWDNAKKELTKIEKDKSKFTSKQYEDAKKRKETAEKAYKDLGGVIGTSSTKRTGGTSKKDTRLEAEKKANEELLKLQQENRQAQLDLEEDTTEKKLQLIDLSYDKQKAEISKKEREFAEQNKKAGATGLNEKGLTAEQQEEIDKANKINEKSREKQIADTYKAEMSAMRDYLKEYGSFQQQKLAIAEEYEQKIREAQTEGERLRLQKEKRKAVAEHDISNLANNIDWGALVSGVGNLVKDMIPPMMEQLEAYIQTPQYQDADIADKEKINSLLNEMRSFFGGQDLETLSDSLGSAISQFHLASVHLQGLREREAELIGQLEDAEMSYKDGTMSTEEYEKLKKAVNAAGSEVAAAQDELKEFGIRVNAASDALANYTSATTSKMLNDTGFNTIEGSGDFINISTSLDKYLTETKKVEREILLKNAEKQGISFVDEMGNDITDAMTNVLEESVGGGISSAMTGIASAIGNGMSGVMGTVAEFASSALAIFLQLPKMILQVADAIKNFVKGILDSFSELLSFSWLEDLVNSILDAVGNLINTILDLPENLWQVLSSIVVNGVGGLVNTVLGRVGNILSFGALSSGGPAEWFTGSNAKEVTETIDRLTNRNELLTVAIEELTDEMANARGARAIDISRRAVNLQEETNKNYALMAQAQAGYHGSHHSWNYYWGGYSQEQINRLSQQIGREWNGDIWSLSPEEMKMLQGNVDMWEQILTTGKGGYGYSVGEKLQAYIDQAGKLEDITNQLYETLTTTTADNVFDDFLSSLYALADGSDEVFDNIADSWQQMVNKMAVNNIVGADFQDKLKAWYKQLAKLNESRTKGNVTDEEYKKQLDSLKEEYDKYVKDAQNDIENLRDIGIIKSTNSETASQSATSRGFGSEMTHEDAGELSGRFTAMYESNIRIESATQQQTVAITELRGGMNEMAVRMQGMYNIADETRTILANSYLELQQISENTGAIIKPIRQIQSDIAEVKRNTSKL